MQTTGLEGNSSFSFLIKDVLGVQMRNGVAGSSKGLSSFSPQELWLFLDLQPSDISGSTWVGM